MNAQLIPVTENGTTGQRLSTSNEANHGDIGSNAVDLSNSDSASTTNGATGYASTAMGRSTEASGDYSTAMGLATEASGVASTAMGAGTEASGTYSTAMGAVTTASDYGSLVIGRYNSSGSTVTNSATAFSTANTAFVIGNGADGNNISDAFSILFDGTTNIAGSVTATSFVGDGSQLTGITGSASSLNDLTDVLVDSNNSMFLGTPPTNSTGEYNTALGYNAVASSTDAINQTIIGYEATGVADNSVVLGNDDVTAVYMGEDSGATVYAAGLNIGGTEITSTAAELNLLSGATSLGTGILSPVTENSNTGVRLSTAVAANHGDIGSNAVDLSYSTSASTTRGATGYASTAMGELTTASGIGSTAMGRDTEASGDYSTAMGYETTASGRSSTAMGDATTASGYGSTAMGGGTIASGNDSTAMGASTTASGIASTAMGGSTTASGIGSTAMGANTTASDYVSLVIGQHNSSGSSVTNSATVFNSANTAFVIGNGVDSSNISDAFSILFDGTTNIAGSVTATSFVGDGSQLTGITGSASSLNDLTDVLVDSNNSMFLGTPPANSTGEYNTALGYKPLYSNTEGDNNTALGENALYSNTTGDDNTASGSGALATNTTGNNNTALGYNAVASSAEAINQTIIGYEATGVADNSVVLGNDDVTAVYMGEDSGATVYAAGLNIGGTEITSTAAELNLLSGATSLGTGILSPVTENSNTGVRLSTAVAANHGDIGSNAVDLSYSTSASTTRGATGDLVYSIGKYHRSKWIVLLQQWEARHRSKW